jgi:large subunit ribosomal protein L25
MSILINAQNRENIGTASAKKIKKTGKIPAVIYEDKANINLSIDLKEFEVHYFKGQSLTSLIEINVDGKKHKVIAHKIELDPVTDRPIHVDFMACKNEKEIRAKPKLIFSNQEKSPGLKKGGMLHIVLRRLEVLCNSEKNIPSSIEIDVGSMHLGTKIRAKDLKLPEGVKLFNKNNFLIGSIIGRGKSEEEKVVDPTATTASTASPAGATPATTSKATPSKGEEKKDAKK